MKNKIFYLKLDLLSSLFVYVSKMSDKYSQSYVKNKKNECPENEPMDLPLNKMSGTITGSFSAELFFFENFFFFFY